MSPNLVVFCPACETGELRPGPLLVYCSGCDYVLSRDLFLSLRRIRALPEAEPYDGPEKGELMSAEENKVIARRWLEALTSLEGAEKAADRFLAPGFVGHHPPFPDVHGSEGYKQFIAGTYGAYPDARFDVEDVIAEGDRVVVRSTLRGTHEGTTRMGVAPTGKEVTASIIGIFKLTDGKIVEMWINADFLGLMQQMDAISIREQQAAT
jgi:predicted ester cyclase